MTTKKGTYIGLIHHRCTDDIVERLSIKTRNSLFYAKPYPVIQNCKIYLQMRGYILSRLYMIYLFKIL